MLGVGGLGDASDAYFEQVGKQGQWHTVYIISVRLSCKISCLWCYIASGCGLQSGHRTATSKELKRANEKENGRETERERERETERDRQSKKKQGKRD